MNQRYDQDNILGYVEGDLSDDQRAAFEAMLEDDHELRQLVSQMKLDRQALRSLGKQSAPVGLLDQVIQSHERAALLGDPAAPEPLALSVPVNRWKFRRVLAYGSVAAVLLLSFGLVVQTLIPPGFFSNDSQFAQLNSESDTADLSTPQVGSGLALLDEDRAYDIDSRSLGRSSAKQSAPGLAPAPGSTPGSTLAPGIVAGSAFESGSALEGSISSELKSQTTESESLVLGKRADRLNLESDSVDGPAMA
jgi:hypothetical protein